MNIIESVPKHRIIWRSVKRRMGWRGRGRSGLWPGAGPFSNLPPWQRPGWVYGYGRGMGLGRGVGYGYGLRGAPYSPWVCQRFPWLPRWWWASPYARAYGTQYPLGYGNPPTYPSALTPDAELEMLDTYVEQLRGEQEMVNKRMEEMKKLIEEGAQTGVAPPTGPMPYGMPTPEQEKTMLEQQAKELEGHIDAIKKRLDDLRKGD